MADPLDWYRSALGGDVGTGIPLNLDRTPVPDTGQGTAWSHLQQAPGDILTSVLGLLERAQLGGANALGLRSPGSDIYRAQIPVEPGLRAAEGAATFATGGLASSLFPAAGALKAGAQYAVPPGTMSGLLADEMGGIRAFHGSPHDFDRFDLSKIGTGEGAQAYGHGLYFAENEGVARGYRDDLGAGQAFNALDDFLKANKGASLQPEEIAARLRGTRAEALVQDPQAIKAMRDLLPNYDPAAAVSASDLRNYRYLNDTVERLLPGHMYEVDINADPKAFLDWDKPLSEQSQRVRDIVTGRNDWVTPDMPGSNIYTRLSLGGADPRAPGTAWAAREGAPAATRHLSEAGIPGIRYLDQGSRGAGEGSYNYAVGDDSLIQILRKYGLLPPVAGAGLMGDDNQ